MIAVHALTLALPLPRISLPIAGALGQAPSASAGAEAARERDVAFLLETIRRVHPDPEHAHDRVAWDAEETRLRKALSSMSEPEFFLGLSRLVALLEDGHSTLLPSFTSLGDRSYPIVLQHFDDGLRVVAADASYAAAVGRRVVAVGGRPLEDVVRLARPCLGADNDYGRRRYLEIALTFPVFHAGLGFASASGARSFDLAGDPAPTTLVLREPEPGPPAFITGIPPDWVQATPKKPPLAAKHADRNYWFEPLPDRNAVYFRFARVEHEEDERFPKFCERLFAEVAEKKAARLVIDLRGNRGGNNYLNQPLVHGVIKSAVNHAGGVLVLIDPATFSAAQNCATYLERETWALFVGTPTGARPNHFGDATQFALPESGHALFCSTVRWQDSDPGDARRWIQPDVLIETKFEDWIEGRDRVLEAALEYEVKEIEGYTGVSPRAHWMRKTQEPALPQGD